MPVYDTLPKSSKVSTLKPENLIIVENHVEGVLIRAARDNFSAKRKCFFIRHLAAEGYIPARFEQLAQLKSASDLWWLVDGSLLPGDPASRQAPVSQVLRTLLVASLVWCVLMALAFLQAPR